MIREAITEDLPQILALSQKLFLDPSSSSDKFADSNWPLSEVGKEAFKGALHDGFLWVTAEDSAVVGFICAEGSPLVDWRPIRRVELLSFYIEPEYRSSGVGAALVQELIKWAKQKEARTVFVSAYADNDKGIDFYRKMGFKDESLQLEKEI